MLIPVLNKPICVVLLFLPFLGVTLTKYPCENNRWKCNKMETFLKWQIEK